MRTDTRRLLVPLAFTTWLLAALPGCGKEVCPSGTGPLSEVAVSFKSFDLGAAAVLEFDSTVTGPQVTGASHRYFSRRIGRQAFPSDARDGSATFIFDPGKHVLANALRKIDFTLTVWIRVYDASGLLLAEGRYAQGGRTDQCWLNETVTVSGSHSCANKLPGDACPSRSGAPYVCRPPSSGGSLACEASTCGDGFVDAQNGELCDPGLASDVACTSSCLPPLVERTIWEPGPQWYELDTGAPAANPPARHFTAGAVITPSGQFLLFGGRDENGTPLGDTWLFDGATWSPVAGAGPPARFGHAMAYHPTLNAVLLVGGSDGDPSQTGSYLGNVWAFDVANQRWEQQSPTGTRIPAARFGAAMAYHPGDGLHAAGVMLFGGRQSAGAPENGWLYTLDGTLGNLQWTSVNLSPAPPVNLAHHTMTWVPARSEMVVAGGQTSLPDATGPASSKLYTLGQTSWTEITGLTNAPAISRHQAVIFDGLGELVLVGGSGLNDEDARSGRNRALKVLSGAVFSTVSPPNVPPPRTGHVAFVLPGRDAIYVFGGSAELEPTSPSPTAITNDTWFYSPEEHPSEGFVSAAGVKVLVADDTHVAGYYDLGAGDPAMDVVDRYAALAVADFDGDGQEEISLGFPGGRTPDSQAQKIGAIHLADPQIADKRISVVGEALLSVFGPSQADGWPRGSWLGGSLAAADLDGDGAANLIFGAATTRGVGAQSGLEIGAFYVVQGGTEQPIRVNENGQTHQIGDPDSSDRLRAVFAETDPEPTPTYREGERFGYAIATGDLDGDGVPDVAVSAPLRNSVGAGDPDGAEAGAVYLLSGATVGSWPTAGNPKSISTLNPVVLRSHTAGLRLGVSLAMGDIDGDGLADLVVGSGTTTPDATCTPPACGAVAIVYGRSGFFSGGGRDLALEDLGGADGALATAPGGASDPLWGLGGLVAVVDLDNDGKGDVAAALGRPSPLDGGPDGVVIFRGATLPGALDQSSDASQATHLLLLAPGIGFGASLAAGDVNGDRRFDLLVGAPYAPLQQQDAPLGLPVRPRPNAGALYAILGSRLASYWDPHGDGSATLELADIEAWTESSEVTVPVIRVRGGLANGFLGVSSATSSHFAQLKPEPPSAYTLIVQPGYFLPTDYLEQGMGRLYATSLQSVLPCGTAATCREICDNGQDDNQDGYADCKDPQCNGHPACPEICNNGQDDDQDGKTDCDDPDCVGDPACP